MCFIFLDLNMLQVIVVPWYSWYHYCATLFNKIWSLVQRRFNTCLRWVGDFRRWESLIKIPAENKAKRLSSIKHSAKSIHHHHNYHHHQNYLCFKNLVVQIVLGETNFFSRKKRFHTTESSVDGCSVQIIVGIL